LGAPRLSVRVERCQILLPVNILEDGIACGAWFPCGCLIGERRVWRVAIAMACTENAESCNQGGELSSPRLGIETGQCDLHIVEPRSLANLHSFVVCALQSTRIGLPGPENGSLFRSCEILRVHNLHRCAKTLAGLSSSLGVGCAWVSFVVIVSCSYCGILPAAGQPSDVSVIHDGDVAVIIDVDLIDQP
jgi:hypothetical protein